MTSVSKSVTVSGKQYAALTAQGASLKLEGGNIMLHGPGAITFKASMKELTGPASASIQGISFPTASKLSLCELRAAGAAAAGDSMVPAA